MTAVRKYSPIVDFEVTLEYGVFITYADGKELHFTSDEYIEFLEANQDLSEHQYDGGEVYDEGEGYFSPALSIDWDEAIHSFKNIELAKSFVKHQKNLVL